jgi:hypothetical protein
MRRAPRPAWVVTPETASPEMRGRAGEGGKGMSYRPNERKHPTPRSHAAVAPSSQGDCCAIARGQGAAASLRYAPPGGLQAIASAWDGSTSRRGAGYCVSAMIAPPLLVMLQVALGVRVQLVELKIAVSATRVSCWLDRFDVELNVSCRLGR